MKGLAIALLLFASSLTLALASSLALALDDGGPEDDAGDMSLDDAGEPISMPMDGGICDGGMSCDPGMAGDAGDVPMLTPACSCETSEVRGGLIHICTGSNDRDTCRQFSCEEAGRVRSDNCPTDDARLCCVMKARHLYSQLYDDCTHPSCESGFREQCTVFGGTIIAGPCEVADNPDPDTEVDDSTCSVSHARPGNPMALLATLSVGLVLGRRRRGRARHAR